MDQTAPDMSMRSLQERAARFGGTNTVRNVFIVAIAYYLGAEIAFLIGTLSDRIFAPFWPPNIVLFCALLVTPPRQWCHRRRPARPHDRRAGHRHADAAIDRRLRDKLPCCNRQRFCCPTPDGRAPVVRHHPQDDPLRPTFVQILGGGSIEDYGLFWARWYASNALGSLTLGPIAMICIESTTRPRFAPTGRVVEAVIIAALLVAACIVAFEDLPSIASGYMPLLLYLPLPIIIWAAVRFGAKGPVVRYS